MSLAILLGISELPMTFKSFKAPLKMLPLIYDPMGNTSLPDSKAQRDLCSCLASQQNFFF